MANIRERRDKNGKIISYQIRVYRGRSVEGKQLKPYTTTFEVPPGWTEKRGRTEALKEANRFEDKCKNGEVSDDRKKFEEYAEYVINLKEQRAVAKHSTIHRYRGLAARIYPIIGHLKLREITVTTLNNLITELQQDGQNKTPETAMLKDKDLKAIIKKSYGTLIRFCNDNNIAERTLSAAIKGKSILGETARNISKALNIAPESLFIFKNTKGKLSPKTIIEHHRFISVVLEQAKKEKLITYNPARDVILPKSETKEVNYFQPETVDKICAALKNEEIKWRAVVHLLLITGARRGEILGLKWKNVDLKNGKIKICNSVMYRPDVGVYEETPKTDKSNRVIVIPSETVDLLKQYKAWQAMEQLRLAGYYQNRDFVFSKDNGEPMHPDSIGNYLSKFSRKYNLPHLNAHAFRHTMASMLYYKGVDSVSISKRLGHAQVSTTANIYAHAMDDADQQSAEILSDIFLKKA